jgi:hypothetical protein
MIVGRMQNAELSISPRLLKVAELAELLKLKSRPIYDMAIEFVVCSRFAR